MITKDIFSKQPNPGENWALIQTVISEEQINMNVVEVKEEDFDLYKFVKYYNEDSIIPVIEKIYE